MIAAVITNPHAGGGTGRAVPECLRSSGWNAEFIGVSGFGGEWLDRTLPEPTAEGYLPRLEAAIRALLAEKPELLITVGGDGTAAYAADLLIREGYTVPIYGIGTGTANVGPIVRFSPAGKWPAPEEAQLLTLGAMELLDGVGNHIAYAFNDAVIGNTFLGTKNGKTVTFDAAALAGRGELIRASALSSLTPEGKTLKISLNGQTLPELPFGAAQLIAAPVEKDSYYGQSYTGLWCYTAGSPYRGAVFLSPTPVVSFDGGDAGFGRWLLGGQLLLKEGDLLRVEGLAENICAVADGNPYLLRNGEVTLRYVPEKIKIYAGR